jgi:hypothetical protein
MSTPTQGFELTQFAYATIPEIPLCPPVGALNATASDFTMDDREHLEDVIKISNHLLDPAFFVNKRGEEVQDSSEGDV